MVIIISENDANDGPPLTKNVEVKHTIYSEKPLITLTHNHSQEIQDR